ncbi:MAG: peptidoglycan DD-metalloendopeptidase family protein [Dethiobacteria bacterium]|jgi:murein DD-endopeptidase MepM/ murein hydrolase activator NlpD|nr:peptidoglycan DD-metalloendopeptidase family protein [Bacillota bacterium]
MDYSKLKVGLFICCFFLLAAPARAIEARGFGPYGPPEVEQNRFWPLYLQQVENYRDEVRLQEQKPEKKGNTKVEIIEHLVQEGETLTKLAKDYNTDISTLAYINNLNNPDYIKAGDTLLIIPVKGVIHRVRSGETVQEIASRYGANYRYIIEANELEEGDQLQEGKQLVIPGVEPPVLQEALAGIDPDPNAGPPFLWPLNGIITSRFGWRGNRFHYGLDIGAPRGTPICAVAAGKVVFSGYKGSYGLKLRLRHDSGWESIYGHNSKLFVRTGDYVRRGQVIAATGDTGYATGPHLHLELLQYGKRLDPLLYLEEK